MLTPWLRNRTVNQAAGPLRAQSDAVDTHAVRCTPPHFQHRRRSPSFHTATRPIMLVAAFVAIYLLNGAVSAPLDDVLPIGPVQMTVWEVLIGVKRQTGRNCPLGYKLCDDGCAPVVSTCCGDGDGSYCRLVEYCTLGGCCPMLRQCGECHRNNVADPSQEDTTRKPLRIMEAQSQLDQHAIPTLSQHLICRPVPTRSARLPRARPVTLFPSLVSLSLPPPPAPPVPPASCPSLELARPLNQAHRGPRPLQTPPSPWSSIHLRSFLLRRLQTMLSPTI